jgi:hypothetical protein
MCFVLLPEQTLTFALYIINRLVFITEVESVYCTVRTESVYNTDTSRPVKVKKEWSSESTPPVCRHDMVKENLLPVRGERQILKKTTCYLTSKLLPNFLYLMFQKRFDLCICKCKILISHPFDINSIFLV